MTGSFRKVPERALRQILPPLESVNPLQNQNVREQLSRQFHFKLQRDNPMTAEKFKRGITHP